MRKVVLIFFLLMLFNSAVVCEEWKALKGEHFIIYYLGDEKFARETMNCAERCYEKIASDLGYLRYDKFWQWEDRAKICIYRSHDDFLGATGKNPWVYGIANYDKKEIISYEWGEGFFDNLLPHEIAHLIFRDFIGFPGADGKSSGQVSVSLWVDEGVAQWEEDRTRKMSEVLVRRLIREKSYIPLTELARINNAGEIDLETSKKLYAEAATIVGYLIKEYGGSSFTFFCRQLRDGKSMDEALSSAYTDIIRNIKELEAKWSEYYGR